MVTTLLSSCHMYVLSVSFFCHCDYVCCFAKDRSTCLYHYCLWFDLISLLILICFRPARQRSDNFRMSQLRNHLRIHERVDSTFAITQRSHAKFRGRVIPATWWPWWVSTTTRRISIFAAAAKTVVFIVAMAAKKSRGWSRVRPS